MEALSLLRKADGEENGRRRKRPASTDSGQSADPSYGLYPEDVFKTMLSREQKRTQRSKRPFLLLLLDVTGLAEEPEKIMVLDALSKVLLSRTRSTDVKGWYRCYSVVGVILTEIGNADIAPAARRVRSKLMASLAGELPWQLVPKLKISFHSYPERTACTNLRTGADLLLYPGIARADNSQKTAGCLKRVTGKAGGPAPIFAFRPVYPIIAALIGFFSKVPVLFKQHRIGQSGKLFTFPKRRSMFIGSGSSQRQKQVRELIT